MNVFRFARLWREAASRPLPEAGIEGPWVGSWRSEGGHQGPLRCVVLEVEDERLHAAFHATYWKIFKITYAPRLHGRRSERGFELAGDWRLGPISGQFRYDGHVTPDHFHAGYRSRNDQGVFEMRRPGP